MTTEPDEAPAPLLTVDPDAPLSQQPIAVQIAVHAAAVKGLAESRHAQANAKR